MYFTSRDLSFAAVFAAYRTVLNVTLAPIFWQITHLPFMCDFLAITALMLTAWFVRKPGIIALTSIISTILNLVFRPWALFPRVYSYEHIR